MKAKRQSAKPTFDPIIITLETEEEAEFLWRLVGLSPNKLKALLEDEYTDYKMPDSVDADIYVALDDVYTPEGDC